MYGKKLQQMLLSYALFAALGDPTQMRSRRSTHEDEDYHIPPRPKVIPAGCKEYTFYGITVVAISEKSARKKIQKQLEKNKTT